MSEARLSLFVADPLPLEVDQAISRIRRMPDVDRVAVMPDVHLAGDFCVGCVVATRDTIYPDAVGGDIGCGMAAVPLDGGVTLEDLDRAAAARIRRGLRARVPIMSRRRPLDARELDEVLNTRLSRSDLDRRRVKDAPHQLGTLGRGNHFLELQRSVDDHRLWLCVHTGSRGMGPAIRAAYAPESGRGWSADSQQGQAYLHDVAWARSFASANRNAILALVTHLLAEELGAIPAFDDLIASDHNHVSRECIGRDPRWVHRKGAVHVPKGTLAIVPGSAGTPTFHVEGRGSEDGLNSSAHGAGRRMSRHVARQAITGRALRQSLRDVWWDADRADRLREEAPAAYKDIERVMRAQKELVRVVRQLRPVLSYKGV